MWRAFIFRGKFSPPFVLVKPQESLHRDNSVPAGFHQGPPKHPHRFWAHPPKKGVPVAFTAYPQDSKCLHTAPNLQENQESAAHHRTQASQHPAPLKTHITGHSPHSTLLQTCIVGHSLYLNHLAIIAISACTRIRKLLRPATNKASFSPGVNQATTLHTLPSNQ